MQNKHLAIVLTAVIAALSWGHTARAALQFSIDINSGGSPTAAGGWTGLDAGTGSVTISGVGFSFMPTVFSSDGHRDRGGPNDLTRDFVFDDGNGEAVGLQMIGLPKGLWKAEVWSWDQTSPAGNQIVGYQDGSAGGFLVTHTFAPSPTDPFTFVFDSTNLANDFGIFTRESDVGGNNRARFNALRLTQIIPEPMTASLALLGLGGLGVVTRRRRSA